MPLYSQHGAKCCICEEDFGELYPTEDALIYHLMQEGWEVDTSLEIYECYDCTFDEDEDDE